MLPSGSQNVKALGHPGRCGLLRERSRLARLRPVYTIRRGALSGAQAVWSSGFDSSGPPSCGALGEAGLGHGLGSPLRCQRVKREIHAATCGSGGWPGPHYFFASKNQPQRTQSSTEEAPQTNNEGWNHHCIPLWLCSVFLRVLCGKAFELRFAPPQKVDLRFLFGLYFFDSRGRLSPRRLRQL